ncbi:MAG: hypothetical protein Q9225_007170 [Loekoesia sp. 1 TL-2023]
MDRHSGSPNTLCSEDQNGAINTRERVSPSKLLQRSPCLGFPSGLSGNFTWSFIHVILHEEQVYVEQLYIIFDVIFLSLRYVAEILLLAAVLTLMMSCMAVAANTRLRTTIRASAAHLVLCGVLGVFWLVILALKLTFYIQCVQGTGNHFRQISNAVLKLNFVYDLLYLIIVFGILAWGTVLLISSTSGNGINRKVSETGLFLCQSTVINLLAQTSTVFFFAISIPLFIRQIWNTTIDGTYNLSVPVSIYHIESEKVWLANQLFYYVCTIVAYAALVAIIRRLQGESVAAEDIYQVNPIPSLATPQASWKGESLRDHSQDPIYNGPKVRDV